MPAAFRRFSDQSLTLVLLIAANLVWRFGFWPVSRGSYTDGILQLDPFRLGMSFWPPLLALLARTVAWLPGLGLEQGGRLIATLCGAFVIWPLVAIARRLFGSRAALWAALAWTASPMALRWSLQPMTDSPFVLLWLCCLASLLLAFQACLPGLFPQPEVAPAPDPQRGAQWLLLAGIAGALATLTRFQGLLLAPVHALAVLYLARVARSLPAGRSKPLNPWLALLPWLAFPVWLLGKGLGPLGNHIAQIGARSGGGLLNALPNYALLFEEFAKQLPFFVGYGVFLFGVFGLLRTSWSPLRLRAWGWVALYLTLVVLALQSVFSSFQERYLLPLLPMVCLFAGHGLAIAEKNLVARKWLFWLLAGLALGYGLVFSGAVAWHQGDPFYDLKLAAQTMGRHPPKGRLLTNESYGAMQLVGPKTRFWSGMEPPRVALLQTTQPLAGDVILLSSYDCASPENYRQLRKALIDGTPARLVQRFARKAYPLLPDIMENGSLAQNPLALTFRYQSQYFETVLLEVLPRPGSGPPPRETPPPIAGPSSEKLEQLQRELKGLGNEVRGLKDK